MIAVQVMANDVAVGFGGAGGYLEMNVYKPLMIAGVLQSIAILSDGCTNFRKYSGRGHSPQPQEDSRVRRALADVGDSVSPVIGYDKASAIAHKAHEEDLTLRESALSLGYVDEQQFDRIVDPRKMLGRDLSGR